jgi:hypothetical protein
MKIDTAILCNRRPDAGTIGALNRGRRCYRRRGVPQCRRRVNEC